MAASVSYLPNDVIRAKAEEILDETHLSRTLPIPIEEIIEFELRMTIVPLSGLKSRHEADGFLCNSLTQIYCDKETMTNCLVRHRFTLAHEIGHRFLHGSYIRAIQCVSDWKQIMLSLDRKKSLSRLETQADYFAGYFLVPSTLLQREWERVTEKARQRGIDLEEMGPFGISMLAGWIAPIFKVSSTVIEICLRRDRLVG